MRIADLSGLRVAVWGAGREGRAALAALAARLPGQRVTVFCSEAETPVARDAGPHAVTDTVAPDAARLSAFDVVIKSPGISAWRPEVIEAQRNGTRFTSGTALWFAEHPDARTIAVTGTKGKSTVSALVAHFLRALGVRTALAGNIGLPLLELLDPPLMADWWVIELSSFQTRETPAVDIGLVNNVYEEHLDWHGSRERYVSDKLALADVARTLVIPVAGELPARTEAHPRRVAFGTDAGWHVADGFVCRGAEHVVALAESPLSGAHNAMNLCAALAAVEAAGFDATSAAPAIARFRPLPHRLQRLGERDGIAFVDDSISTTPEATREALASLAGRAVTVLVGGHDRGLDWHGFADFIVASPPHAIVTMGANGSRIARVLREAGGACQPIEAGDLADAFAKATAAAPKGGVVLLSPGAPSFDQFRDYAERGRAFARLAGFDPDRIGTIEGLGIA